MSPHPSCEAEEHDDTNVGCICSRFSFRQGGERVNPRVEARIRELEHIALMSEGSGFASDASWLRFAANEIRKAVSA